MIWLSESSDVLTQNYLELVRRKKSTSDEYFSKGARREFCICINFYFYSSNCLRDNHLLLFGAHPYLKPQVANLIMNELY